MKGILLINTGTPDAPEPKAVGKYLRQFLMDPLVIDIPFPLRWMLVNLAILPKRSEASAALYKKVWRPEGSPLAIFSRQFTEKLQHELGSGYKVVHAMRYGEPSIEWGIQQLQREGITDILTFPLFPQYSLAATKSALEEVKRLGVNSSWIPPFYNDSGFLDSLAQLTSERLSQINPDFVLFSFHGLPERQVKKTSLQCFTGNDCSTQITAANQDCYRAQSYYTANQVAKRLALPADKYGVGFQSRLGRTPWIQPYSDAFYRELPKRGVKNLAVLCPSFVADCLETLEEVAIRGNEEFRANGGEKITLIPCLNDDPRWVKAAASLVRANA